MFPARLEFPQNIKNMFLKANYLTCAYAAAARVISLGAAIDLSKRDLQRFCMNVIIAIQGVGLGFGFSE